MQTIPLVCDWVLVMPILLTGIDTPLHQAFDNWRAAPLQGPEIEGAWALLLRNLVQYILCLDGASRGGMLNPRGM